MMHDYYAFYTWAMDKQQRLEREAAQRRKRDTGHVHIRLRWPLAGRRRITADGR